jgi:hypothetical protein
MDIPRLRRSLIPLGLRGKSHLGLLVVMATALMGVVSRVVDRDESGRWVFWQKSYFPDGYNYIWEAININSWGNREVLLGKLEEMFLGNSSLLFNQSVAVTNTLDARPVYPLITSLFLDANFAIAPLVAPIISWFLLNILIYHHIRKFHGTIYALVVVVIFSSSFYMRFNFIGTTTDSLSALFTYLVFHYLFQQKQSLMQNLFLNLFLLLAILTRPLDPIFLMLFIGMTLSSIRNRDVSMKLLAPIVLLISHLIYIQVKYQQLEVGSLNTGGEREGSFLQYLFDTALRLPKLIFVEFSFLAVNDFLFFLLCMWILLVLSFQKEKIFFFQFILVFLSTFYLAALNGPIGNGFRYQLPLVMFGLVVIRIGDSPRYVWQKLLCIGKKITT